jgi:hypothetical protein
LSYKPVKEMTDEELQSELEVWERAVVRSQIREWVDAADRYRNTVCSEQNRRRRERRAA